LKHKHYKLNNMAQIINTSINLTVIPKHKIIDGKKGKYLPITITLNDEPDQFGNDGPVTVAQTKDERESKEAKTYLGNAKVVWDNGQLVASRNENQSAPAFRSEKTQEVKQDDDLPF
tara:strand:- start:9616 stop:9966 length:351 start_codon:yes stop_codon:yes gene_type:complete